MAKIDLDAARAARREKRNGEDSLELVFSGETYRLPAEIPFEAIERMGESDGGPGQVRAIVDEILGDSRTKFWETKPSLDDVNLFIEGALREYGLTAGES